MKINIHEIPPQGHSFEYRASTPWIHELISKAGEFKENYKIDVNVIRDQDLVAFSGLIIADLALECSRCCEKYLLHVDRTFLSTFCKEFEKRKTIREEIKLTKADLDLTFYTGEEINLSELLNEQLQLAVPYRPICKEDCKGLCSYCGKNLNIEECNCEKQGWNPKFSALLKLKNEERIEK
jgi:uncharacterized protein